MKKIKLSFLAVLLLGAVACNKSNTTLPGQQSHLTTNVTSDEAADMVANSVSLNSNGVANVADDATLNATTLIKANATCGTIKSDTISRQSVVGAATAYSYYLTYNYTVNCNSASQPDSLMSSLIYTGSFNGPNLSSTNSGSSNFSISGLLPTATGFVINGEYKRNGSFKSKIDTTNAGNSNIDIKIAALTLKKPGRFIVSGSATISLTGIVPKKGAFSYTGTLVFNGDGTATLTINGTVYKINLSTGARIRATV